jgi:hypothetical protein
MNIGTRKTRPKPLILSGRDEKILLAIYQYRYMTALDVAWLLFKPTSHTHVREILSALAGGEDLCTQTYLCRFGLPGVGNALRVFTLGGKGRRVLAERGFPMNWYFRPYKVGQLSTRHTQHNLILTRFLVALNVWIRSQQDFRLSRIRFGHELSGTPPRVTIASQGKAVTVPVIPDAWLLIERAINSNHIPIFLEIDRGMEFQKRFKEHIRSRITFYEDGGYTRMFGSKSVMICYATTGQTPKHRETRRDTMRRWTREVLTELGKENWAGVFRFASSAYQEIYNLTLFEKSEWYRPDSPQPVRLLGA